MPNHGIALQNRFLGRGETLYDRLAARFEAGGGLAEDDLRALAGETGLPPALVRSVAAFYEDFRRKPEDPRISVCNGEACAVAGAGCLRTEIEDELGERPGTVTCLGLCAQAPAVRCGDRVLSLAGAEDRRKFREALRSGAEPEGREPKLPFFRARDPRHDRLLANFDRRMTDLETARAAGAFEGLRSALKRGREETLREIEISGLRGRGGAGFPCGRKLRTVAEAPARDGRRVLVCNADEGDAGAYIDKALCERDPFAVLEGMALAAYAAGAEEGFLYLRAEYPRAARILARAIEDAERAGFLGEGAFGEEGGFQVRLVKGHGAYICGEETSLLRSLEGLPAQVTPKPPYPAVEGYRGRPTAVQNVETLANLPPILREGGRAFAALGRGRSRGTKLVSLNEAVARPGLYEVEMGITLRDLIFDLAGGMAEGKEFLAVQVGGPLGGIFPAALLDTPLTFEDMEDAGGLLGHAGVVVYPEGIDLVAIGRGLMAFCAVESCGKCFPCRLGSVRGVELFDRILGGKGSQRELDLLSELSETMRFGSLCALGGGIPTPISNLLEFFPEAFRAHVPGARTPERVLETLKEDSL